MEQRCAYFPDANDVPIFQDFSAPFSVGDQLLLNRPVYAVSESGECDASTDPVADVFGYCVVTKPPTATQGPTLSCQLTSQERDCLDYFSLSVVSILGGPSEETYEQIITGGTGKFAGISGKVVVDVHRIGNPLDNIGIDYSTGYAAVYH